MSGGAGNGWGSVVGELDEDAKPDDRTDPDFRPPAAEEEDQVPESAARQVFDLKQGNRVPAPSTPASNLSLPSPKAPSLRLPTPGAGPSPAPKAAPISLDNGEVFSSDALLDKLGVEDSPGAKTSPSIWQDKEMRRAATAAVLLILAFFAYRSLSGDESSAPSPETGATIATPDQAAPAKSEAKTPALAGRPSPGPAGAPDPKPARTVHPALLPPEEPAKPPEPKPTVYPMLSVMTTPPGATVMVNGLVRGETPLVMRSPSPDKALKIRITKKKYKAWEKVVQVNDTGHFVVRAVLEDR